MKIDLIRVRNVPENWEINLLLRERDIERRRRAPRAIWKGIGFGLTFTAAVLGILFWRFYL